MPLDLSLCTHVVFYGTTPACCRDAPWPLKLRFFVWRTYAKRKCMHAVWCEVPSPDGAVGREWCYVEVAPFGSLHVRRMVAHSPCCCLALVVLSVCFIVSTCVTVAFLLLRLCASVVAWVVRMMLVARVQRIGFVGWGGVTRPPVVARQPLRKRRCRVIARRGLITGRCGCELRTHMLKRAMNLLKW